MTTRLHPLLLLGGLLAGMVGVGVSLWPVAPQTTRPVLSERYAEAWGGPAGAHLPNVEAISLDTKVGAHQMFTPAVCAPPDTALSQVVLTVCVPWDLSPEVATGWTAEGRLECARFIAKYTIPVTKGTCGNPKYPVFLRPAKAGTYRLQYAIQSDEAADVDGSFLVEVSQ